MFYDPSRVTSRIHTIRRSSWDTSGRNRDFILLQPGQRVLLLDEQGPGKIAHFYWTTINASRFHFRQLVLRAWWDGESTPSIEAPLGDLFGVPHCTPVPLRSLAAVVNPGNNGLLTWGLNLYLPMPFATSARMELAYEAIPGHPAEEMAFWYHLDMEKYDDPLPEDVGRLHAQWRRENPTTPKEGTEANSPVWNGVNLDGRENYCAVAVEGRGQMVGLHLQVDNLGGGWYGEGDDMVFVDGRPGEQWPPAYHGTGSEEIFGGGACPNEAYHGPYTGFHLVENADHAGKNAMYRWYLADPIRFERSLVWTIEHGHDNNYENDYTSVAYWYQLEPHAPFPSLPDVTARLPRFSDVVVQADVARAECAERLRQMGREGAAQDVLRRGWDAFNQGIRALVENRPEEAIGFFTAQ